jgi:hypothetical protein
MDANWNPEKCQAERQSAERDILGRIAHLQQIVEERMTHSTYEIGRLADQVQATNGRVTKLERWQIALMATIIAIAVMRWPELIALLRALG